MNFVIIIMYHLADPYYCTSYDSMYQNNKVQQFIGSEPLDFIPIIEAA